MFAPGRVSHPLPSPVWNGRSERPFGHFALAQTHARVALRVGDGEVAGDEVDDRGQDRDEDRHERREANNKTDPQRPE